jgi:oxygen-independent coproporphyrinogen-3 oxidase
MRKSNDIGRALGKEMGNDMACDLASNTLPPEPANGHLYLHIPYCQAKCPYCDFNSIAGRDDEFTAYAHALAAEIATLPPGPYQTIFVGGGTPSIFTPQQWEIVSEALHRHLLFADDYEWTVEANPGSADAERFAAWATTGVNRISLGVQSLDDNALKFLGRVHNHAEAELAVRLAQKHVPRVSADIIIGLPDQPLSAIADVLAFYRRHNLQHASVYNLMIEPGTEFHARHRRGELPTASDESVAQQLEYLHSGLDALGLHAYETSNYAAPGQACRHNLAYWYQHDYQAAGAGAVSLLGKQRQLRHQHPAQYIAASEKKSWVKSTEDLSDTEWLTETWMLGLRLSAGININRLHAAGDEEHRWRPTADRLIKQGMLSESDGHLRLTQAGRLVQDAVTVALLP